MTIETHNWASSAHQEFHKIVREEIFPIVNQVDTRVQNFKLQFLKEAAKFVGDFKSLANEADTSLAKHKALELEIERLLKAVVSQDILSIVQNASVVDTSVLQTELECHIQDETKTIIASLQNELQSNIYKNAKLRLQLFKKVSDQKDNTQDTSANTKFAKQPIVENLPKVGEINALSNPVTSNSVSTPQESKGVNNDKVIAPGIFRINPSKTSREEKHVPNTVSVSIKEIQKKCQPKVTKPRKLGTYESLATPKPRKSRLLLRHMTGNLKILINFVWKFMGTVRFGNDHVAAILGFGDRSTNLYTINLHEMTSASPICLMARASSTKSWLWHQRLSHLNFDTINDLARNDLVAEITSSSYGFVWTNENYQYKWKAAIATACFTQNRSIIHRRLNKTPYELINGRKPNISFLHVFSALCYPKNNREDIRKLGAKGEIGFFIGYSADSCAYRVYNRRTKKIMETMNVSFDELSVMAFEQCSSKPGLNSMNFGHISSGLDLSYAPSTITMQQPSEGELDLLFEAMYDDYIGGQPLATTRTVPPAQEPNVRQSSTASTTIADIAPIPTNSSSLATNVPITSQDVDELNPNAMIDGNTFVNPFVNSSTSAAASSSLKNVDPSNMHTFYQPYPHEFQ
nr:retrovirus-related Pol polyprotein from transposon TNT 1-94 [Tanacetum cinerariifolium]